jgi:dipeptidyl aminopeptidase/acylaminoacyl peptidase
LAYCDDPSAHDEDGDMTKASAVVLELCVLLLATGCARSPRDADPILYDPPTFDLVHPPRMAALQLESEGAILNGIVYEAQGEGPHPTVVLLHGYPGNERNLDLAQVIRRAGWNVLFFHYRGAWGSGGVFTFGHLLEDVDMAIDTLGEPAFARAHRIDPSRIALVGHSMGGFAALLTAAENDEVDCVVSIGAANLGGMAQAMRDDPEALAHFAALWDERSAPIRRQSGMDQAVELASAENAERFDTIAKAPALARKPVLLIAGGRDQTSPADPHHTTMVEALERAGATSLETALFEKADHSFSGQRVALALRITRWLNEACRAPD